MADDTYTVQRSATIDAPQARIYEQISDFHNWPNWSPWEDIDPEL
ncbi:MAG: SRPBCC family protein, partial [Propionibacteriales bacterium]|nr:SRPBCC family protein [Propionibacteriales bacterium]